MIRNYLLTALRSIQRSATYTFINVTGLALGITCAILIFSIVSYHLSFDNFHQNADRIYRFVTEEHRDKIDYDASVPPAFGKAFREDYTFGEKVARVCRANAQIAIESGGNVVRHQEELAFVDHTYLEIFNFSLVAGTNELDKPGTAIISERIAKKYFSNESAIGKTIRFDNEADFRIAAVMKDIPDNTDFRAEILLSYLNIGGYSDWYAQDDAWGGITSEIQTFTLLRPGVDPAEVEKVLPAYVKKFRSHSKNVHHYKLQPLADIHFNPLYGGRISTTTLWVLSIIGFFLVFTACLNFINLATALAVGRSREVGVRKALGSSRAQLFWQFTLETFTIVAMALVFSAAVAYAVIPMMNTLLDSRIVLDISDYRLWMFAVLLAAVVTFLSGAYPGLLLSGVKPVHALKGDRAETRPGSFNVRRLLITAQFTISQVLIIGLIVVLTQMKFFHNADLGYDKDAIIMVPVGSRDEKAKTLKEQLSQLPDVRKVSICYSAPSGPYAWGTSIKFDNRSESETFQSRFKAGDEDYFSIFGFQLVSGRNVFPSDTVREYLVNETMVTKLGETTEGILGKTIFFNGEFTGAIVGVVADFHDESLRNPINPVFITTSIEHYNFYALKVNMTNVASVLSAVEKTWLAMYPDQIFQHQFLDEQTREFYQAEAMILRVIEIFSLIALLIGSMGLYGLASFMAVRKTKEIGIRKVLGGSVQQILWIFGKEFSRLVGLAFLIAAPVSWFLMSKWLSNYEYKIDLGVWIFVADLAFVAVVVLITVGFRTAKAAMMNPVGALRTE
jgi:putative ABC transport system permease protein